MTSNFGVETEREAKDILRRLDRVLSSYGVRLNTGKTKILTSEEAARHFWIQDNRALGVVRNLIEEGSRTPRAQVARRRHVERSYRRFASALERGGLVGHWEKVQKRYLDLLGRLGSPLVVRRCAEWMRSRPGLRSSVLRYFQRLGFTRGRYRIVADFIRSDCVDDVALFACVRLLVQWRIPRSPVVAGELLGLASELGKRSTRAAFVPFVAGLWLMAKYASRTELESFVTRHRDCWAYQEWAGRQVAAAAPRFSDAAVTSVRRTLVETGQVEGLRVLDHLDRLKRVERLDRSLKSHLDPELHRGNPYPFSKILLLIHFLSCRQLADDILPIREKVAETVHDPVLARLLREVPVPHANSP